MEKVKNKAKIKIRTDAFYLFVKHNPYLFWSIFIVCIGIIITGVLLKKEILENPIEKTLEFNALPPDLEATVYLVAEINTGKVLAKKNGNLHLFPASLAKLMTGMIVLDNFFLNEEIFISSYAKSMEGEEGGLVAGEIIKVDDLLKVLLLPSSNDAAKAFEEALNKKGKDFIELMNKKAREIGLFNTAFFDASGLDRKGNFSNVEDLFILSQEIYNHYPYLGEISRQEKTIVYSVDKQITHNLQNTNILTGQINNLWGGKTGSTPEARDCLLTIYEFSLPEKNGKIVISIIVLNSVDRFGDTMKLYNWVNKQLIINSQS